MNGEADKLSGDPENPEAGNRPEIHPAIMQAIKDHVGKVKDLVEIVQHIASELCSPEDGSLPTEEEFDTETWNELKKSGKFFAVMNASQKGVPEKEVKRFLWTMIAPFVLSGNYGTAYRTLNNTKIASPELCEFVGQKAVDALFEKRGALLKPADIEDELRENVKGATLQAPLYLAAVERLTSASADHLPTAAVTRQAKAADKPHEVITLEMSRQRLREMRERKELSPHNYDWQQFLYFQEMGYAINRSDVGDQAIVLTREELEELQYIDVRWKDGSETRVEISDMKDEEMIIFPDDLGLGK